MNDTVLRGGTVWQDERGMVNADVVIADGRITEIASSGTGQAANIVDVTGLTVLPGAIDAHIHLGHGTDISRPRVPNDAITETGAAARGGVTSLIPYILSAEPYTDVTEV